MTDFIEYVGIFISAAIAIFLAAFGYANREGFRRAANKGQNDVTATVLTNTIKELEKTNKEIDNLVDRLDEQTILITKLQERIRYLTMQINELRERLKLSKIRYEDVEDEEGWK